MTFLMTAAVSWTLAYLAGSISCAILVCRAFRLPDPRTEGSHNPGATNVLRIGGKKPAALTLLGDMLKGTLPVLAARLISDDPAILAGTGLAAFLGHLYPVFFRFEGGKGVATALGVLLGWHWSYWLFAAGTWLIVSKGFRISSLAALIAFALTPLFLWWLGAPAPMQWATMAIVVLMFWRHRTNIRRLIEGSEDKIDAGS